jgi:uncharacterized protein DUF4157
MLATMAADPDQHDREEHERHRTPAPPQRTPEPLEEAAESPVERLASGIGNRNFRQVVARMAEGEGIMANGNVHPDVQATIAAMSGAGTRLDRQTISSLAPTHGDVSDARIHVGHEADRLARTVNAEAFTVGQDVFFRHGAYDTRSKKGKQLIAHELTHVVQQRGAPADGPLEVSQPGDAMEREADRVSRDAAV